MVIATWLGLLGIGLGTYIPASNTAIMMAIPPRQAATVGGTGEHGLRTRDRLEVAVVVTPALHPAARLGHAPAGPAAATLAICALPPAWARRRVGAVSDSCAVRAWGRDPGAVPR